MATTTDAAPVAPVEEESAAPAATEEEPPKKVEAAVATTDAAPVAPAPAPVEDETPAPAAAEEEPTKKVEAAAAAEEEEVEEDREAPKKALAGGGEKEEEEDVRLEGEGEGFGGPEAENGQAEGVGGGYDGGEVKEAEEDDKGVNLGAAEAEKDDGDEEPASEDGEAAASGAAIVPAVESKSENGELGEGDPSLAFHDALEGDEKGELREEQQQEEERGAAVEVKVVDKVSDDAEAPVAEEEKLEPEVEKSEEVGSGGGDGGELSDEKEVEVSPPSEEAAEPQDKVAPEANGELGDEKEGSDDVVALGGEEAPDESTNKDADGDDVVALGGEESPEESTKKDADVEDEATKPEPPSEASPVVMKDGSIEELAPASANSVLEDSPEKEQNAEDQATASEAVEDVGVDKPTEVESVAALSADGILSRELSPESSNENNGADEIESATEVVDREVEAADNDIIEVVPDDEDGVGNEADDDDDGANSDTSPARVAILESSEAAKQIMKELAEGSSGRVSRDFTNSMDGQIMLDDSEDDEDDDDNDDGDEKGFDSAALAALLKAATGGSSDGNITVSSQDGSRIFTMDRPAGLGSSAPSLRPTAPRQPARSNLFSPSELAVTADPTEEMTEEEKKLHDKVELIRVKFLRLVYRLGATPEETVAAQVLYRLSLAEGIRHGRQTNRAFSLDNARRKALLLEAEGKEDLNFSCNILVLGKTGVGKSATINSIFGEEKSKTDAFSSATTNVWEIVGDVDGVKIRIIDTPGLRPNVMDQGSNRKILAAVKKYTKKCPPDIVLYVDRLDSLSRDLNDLPLLKTITAVLGSSIWFNAIVALTHAASAPPEGLNGNPMTYEVLMAQRSHIIQQSIRQAAGDMRLMNPVALVENHPSCRKNREGQKVLPNGQSWRHQMLLLCYSSKILSEANSLLKLQDPNPGKLFGFRFRSPPLPFLLSSLLQSRAHPKLSAEQGGNEGDSDIELDDYSDVEQDDDEEEYDQLPPFKPLTKAQLARLTKEQKNAYFDEYDYRVKLLQKKQWKDEIRRLKEMKRGKTDLDDYGYANIAGENDQDPPPENVSVPLPDMVLPPSFDCDNPTYRYRFLEPTSTVLARPVLDAHGWDHDCGYDGVSVEETLAILSRFPANVAVQVTKDKKEFSIHLDSSIAAKHGENASSLAGFDIQTVGRQLAYILRGETKIKNIKKNKTTGGFSVTFLGDIVATGLKVEDQLSLGKRLSLVASTGAMRAQGDTAYGANLEARLKDKDYPIGQSLSTLGLSLMKWRRDLALGANLQSQFSIGRGSKMAVRLGLNNKLSGQITVRTSTSEQVQIALLGLIPVAASIYRSFRPSEPSFAY
ncbi:translocase of chloroplast 101, chloroplastic-like [Miscanthus floridulus]|uniref:translocase of chloroplast 101, chloroplastic-like n=1 Tax=Miscanthus floridulus TaxID=154761 RepID=UPI003457D43B